MTKFLNISTDSTLGGASPADDVVSSQKAIKEYVDNIGMGANTDLSNLTAAGKSLASNMSMPSGTPQSVTVGASGTEYTASKDGVYYFKMENTNLSRHWVNVHVDGQYVANYWAIVANNSFGLPPFFVRKGGKIKITYGADISGGNCYFVPTVGAN